MGSGRWVAIINVCHHNVVASRRRGVGVAAPRSHVWAPQPASRASGGFSRILKKSIRLSAQYRGFSLYSGLGFPRPDTLD